MLGSYLINKPVAGNKSISIYFFVIFSPIFFISKKLPFSSYVEKVFSNWSKTILIVFGESLTQVIQDLAFLFNDLNFEVIDEQKIHGVMRFWLKC